MIVSELMRELGKLDPWADVVVCMGPESKMVGTIRGLDYFEIEPSSDKPETYRIQPGAAITAVLMFT